MRLHLKISREPTTNEMEKGSSYTVRVRDHAPGSDSAVAQFLTEVHGQVEAKAREAFGNSFIKMNQLTKQPTVLDLTLEVGIELKKKDAFRVFAEWITSLSFELETTPPQ